MEKEKYYNIGNDVFELYNSLERKYNQIQFLDDYDGVNLILTDKDHITSADAGYIEMMESDIRDEFWDTARSMITERADRDATKLEIIHELIHGDKKTVDKLIETFKES